MDSVLRSTMEIWVDSSMDVHTEVVSSRLLPRLIICLTYFPAPWNWRVKHILTQWSAVVSKWHSACGAQRNLTPTGMCWRNQIARPPSDSISVSIPWGLSTLLMGHMCWELYNIKHGEHFLGKKTFHSFSTHGKYSVQVKHHPLVCISR